MSETQNNKGLKTAVVVLFVLLLGAVGYIVKLSSDVKETTTELAKTESEKDALIADLEALKVTYDQALVDNTQISEELKAERDKVEQLLVELKQSKATAASLGNYKKKYLELEAKFNALIKENELLKQENQGLTQAIDSTQTVLSEERQYNQKLLGQNEELTKIVDEASKLSILNLKTTAYKIKNSGKEIETDKARRTDALKIQFTIAENRVAKQGDRSYYVQVIDGKMNVLGDKKNIDFGDQQLTYSFISTVNFKNSTLEVSEILRGDDFEKGLYHVHIYDGKTLVASQSFTLR